jgi:hypothetical protein
MKKIGTYFLIILLSVIVFLLGFDYKTSRQPHTYYQVYLDEELIGMIESKKELETYINSQANEIRKNMREYNLKLEAIDTLNKYESNITEPKEKVEYLITNKETYKLTDLDIENLNFYKKEKLYSYEESEINEMRNYVSQNDIYDYVNEIYTPNGIEIKKVYTYHDDVIPVEEIYKDIIAKKSCTILGYKFTIKSDKEELGNIEIYTVDKNKSAEVQFLWEENYGGWK